MISARLSALWRFSASRNRRRLSPNAPYRLWRAMPIFSSKVAVDEPS